MYNTFQEAQSAWRAHRGVLSRKGLIAPEVVAYLPEPFKGPEGDLLAYDAQPALATVGSAGIPAMLTTTIDPEIVRIIFAPNKAAMILGEVQAGTWVEETRMFPVLEATNETSSYGDYAESGNAGVNTNWPQRQMFLFQIMKRYGDRELDRAGLAKINLASEIDASAAMGLSKFSNFAYFFGISNLQCYGLLNDPNLPAALTPGTKVNGNGNVWITAAGVMNASANEVFNDIMTLFQKLVVASAGNVDKSTKMVLALSPGSEVALSITNSFGLSVSDLLKKNYPNIRVETAVQYGAKSTSNPQGVAGGNLVQLIAEAIEGQKTGYCAYSEKVRSHPIVRKESSYAQKQTSGTWGTIIKLPVAFQQMIGI